MCYYTYRNTNLCAIKFKWYTNNVFKTRYFQCQKFSEVVFAKTHWQSWSAHKNVFPNTLFLYFTILYSRNIAHVHMLQQAIQSKWEHWVIYLMQVWNSNEPHPYNKGGYHLFTENDLLMPIFFSEILEIILHFNITINDFKCNVIMEFNFA